MLARTFSVLKNFSVQKDLYMKVVNVQSQYKLLSSKPPVQPIQKHVEGEQQKKAKKQPIPKITLIASNDNVSVTTLEEAQQLSKRRDLKLVKIVDFDTKTQRPVYKLMTGSEYHSEDLKQREQRKKDKESSSSHKGEKLLMLNSAISQHDLETNINKILKWITKKYEVRVVINGYASNMEKTDGIYTFMEEALKDSTRFLQKRTKGNDMKFQIIPPKDRKDNEDKGNSKCKPKASDTL